MKIITAQSCLEYEAEGHPENPRRVARTRALLQQEGYQFTVPISCTEHDILRVHSQGHVESVRTGTFFEADTPNLPGMFEHAKLSAGAAIQAAEFALHGDNAFSLMRPPGHHACRKRLMGFCYFNNIAIAIASVLEAGTTPKTHDYEHGMEPKRVAVLDFDCHHGNGSEEILFGNPNVLFLSLHQHPCYPGTGSESRGNCINYPLPPGTGETDFLNALEDAAGKVADFKPDLLAVSAGFDSYRKDPITDMDLDIGTFGKTGRRIRELKLPTFSLLEGGYSPDLPQCILAYLRGLES